MGPSSDLPSREEINAVFDRLIDQVQSNASTTTETIASGVNELKEMHRKLYGKIHQAEAEYDRKLALYQKRQRNAEAAQYERKHLEQRINLLKSYATPHLLQLAREGEGTTATTAAAAEDQSKSDADILREYFNGRDVSNPEDRDHILLRLHQEINSRGKLEQTVKSKKEQLGKLLKEVKTATQLLTSLPQHVAAIERASMPLQKLFPDSLVGSERKTRLEQAQSLPAPLYVLFQQLQQYTDSDHEEKHRPTLSIDKDQVLFQLPVVGGQSASAQGAGRPTKRVTIHFVYDESSNLVTASASGCGNVLFQDVLLQELFPGDAPVSTNNNQRALPYHWCNYLSGLYLLPQQQQPEGQPCFFSTRVIVHELQRRVRANAALKSALLSFQRGIIPSLPQQLPPLFASASGPLDCKLTRFEALENDNPLVSDFAFTLVKDRASLKGQVQIHTARYPAVPPVWSLSGEGAASDGHSDGDNNKASPLYDATFADLERRVNFSMLEQICETGSSSLPYEWIIVFQLREIMTVWASRDSFSVGGRKRKALD